MQIWLKRAYDKPADQHGTRVLVDRAWPRGLSKDAVQIDLWLKEIAPSAGLRKWFSHDPDKWQEFKERYFQELEEKKESVERLEKTASKGRITLVFAAKNRHFNNAAALKEYLSKHKRP